MAISSMIITPIYIASFVLLAYQYWSTQADKFLFNRHFWLMAGAIVLMFAANFPVHGWFPLVLFLLALIWLGISIHLFRLMKRAK